MEEKKEPIILFENDYVGYLEDVAKTWRSYKEELFPSFPYQTDAPQELLENLGMEEEDIDHFFTDAYDKNEEEAYDMLEQQIDTLAKANEKGAAVIRDFVVDQLLEDQWFYEQFDEEIHRDIQTDYKYLFELNVNEPHLILGSDIGWRHLKSLDVLTPETDIATTILQSERGGDMHLQITQTEGEPCFRATAYTHDAPTGENYVVIPQTWAKEAFNSKDFHDELLRAIAINEDAEEFFANAKAIDGMEKDPVTYGIVEGMMQYASPYSNDPKKIEEKVRLAATKIANFSMQGMETYCKNDPYCDITPSNAVHRNGGDAYEAAKSMRDLVPSYLKTIQPAKESPLTRGIEKILEKHPDKIHKMLGEFVTQPKKVIQSIQKLGRTAVPAR